MSRKECLGLIACLLVLTFGPPAQARQPLEASSEEWTVVLYEDSGQRGDYGRIRYTSCDPPEEYELGFFLDDEVSSYENTPKPDCEVRLYDGDTTDYLVLESGKHDVPSDFNDRASFMTIEQQ